MSIVHAESLNDRFSYFAGTEVKLTNVFSKRHHPIIICKMSILHSLVYNFKNIQNEVISYCKWGSLQNIFKGKFPLRHDPDDHGDYH